MKSFNELLISQQKIKQKKKSLSFHLNLFHFHIEIPSNYSNKQFKMNRVVQEQKNLLRRYIR